MKSTRETKSSTDSGMKLYTKPKKGLYIYKVKWERQARVQILGASATRYRVKLLESVNQHPAGTCLTVRKENVEVL